MAYDALSAKLPQLRITDSVVLNGALSLEPQILRANHIDDLFVSLAVVIPLVQDGRRTFEIRSAHLKTVKIRDKH